MATGGPMVTATDTADLLKLSQWLSPAFPVSSYAYSHGLEAEIAQGRVTTAAEVTEWVRTVLTRGAGQADAILMRAARAPDADLEDLTDLARALASSRERLEETEAQGRALAETLSGLGQGDGAARPYPIALGLACRALSLSDDTVAALYLQAFASMLVSAAVRFMPLGQAEGQTVLADLHSDIEALSAKVVRATPDQITQAAFGADLAAIEHETLEVRIFRS